MDAWHLLRAKLRLAGYRGTYVFIVLALHCPYVVRCCYYFIAGVLSPAAQAQNSGSGWVAQPNPAAANASVTEYDWDGYHVADTILYKRISIPNDYISPDQFSAGQDPSGGQKEMIKAKGDSMFKWFWTPTGSNVGAPAPSLYVLGEASAFADALVLEPIPGFSASVTFHYSSTIDGLDNGQVFFWASQYKIEATHVKSLAAATLKPTMTATFTSTPTSPGSIGNASSSVSAFPIILANPNPMNRPDLGDGTNQYMYDATATNGFLNFPGAVQAVGSSAGDTAWIMRDPADVNGPHVALNTDLPAETTSAGWFYLDASLNSSVPADQIVVKSGTIGSPSDGFLFQGLPKLNTSLGNHLVTLTVDNKPSEQSHIQTFFSAKADNYPGAAADYAASSTDPNQQFYTPNWFFYYNQVSKATGNYEPGDQTQTDATTPYAVHIEDQTYGDIPGIHVYALKPGADRISWAGDIELYGIWLYDDVCAHEEGHQTAFSDGTYAISTDPNDPTKPWVLTSDEDHLDDTWEDNHYFNSKSSNTTGAPAYPNEGDAPDDETVADIVGLGGFLTALSDWQKDWAGVPSGSTAYTGGVQFETSHLAVKPGQTYPTPYFLFTPFTRNADKSFTEGTPIKIWSSADLKAAVPGLMTSLLAKPNRPK